jgi:glyoxylase-like metal-dependent hydrolase (beta-lactamase superfamily II)
VTATPEYSITALKLGNIGSSAAGMYKGGSPDLSIDVPVWGVAVEGNGLRILIDSGIENPAQWNFSVELWQESDETLERALAEIGWSATSVDIVINTHLHFDHASNNRALRNAQIVVSRTEWDYALDPVEHQRQLYRYQWMDGSVTCGSYILVTEDFYQVVPGVTLIQTPGHTPGHQSVLVYTAEGTLCVTGDAACLTDNFSTPAAPGDTTDTDQALQSIEKIRGLCDRVLMNHDPTLKKYQREGFPLMSTLSPRGALATRLAFQP